VFCGSMDAIVESLNEPRISRCLRICGRHDGPLAAYPIHSDVDT
jgi:hypothetical protein